MSNEKKRNFLNIQFTDKSEGDDNMLTEVLKTCERILPNDYYEFLSMTNGGSPSVSGIWLNEQKQVSIENNETADELELEVNNYPLESRQRLVGYINFLRHATYPERINRFFSATGDEPSLRWFIENTNFNGNTFAHTLLPIAEFEDGALIFLSCDANRFGQIFTGLEGYAYLFEPELENDGQDAVDIDLIEYWDREWSSCLIKIANDFTSLLRRLVPARIEYSSGYVPNPSFNVQSEFASYTE